MTKLLILLSMVMVMIAQAGADEGEGDAEYMDSERVMGADAGKEAFNGMLDAVNSAAE